MEIEKKRETSWKIELKNKNENIELTSVEISGEVRNIKLALIKNDKSIQVEMNKEEFYNFLSLISAFKDVVIGEDTIIVKENSPITESKPQKVQESTKMDKGIYHVNSEPSEEELQNNDEGRLNPEEWDPW